MPANLPKSPRDLADEQREQVQEAALALDAFRDALDDVLRTLSPLGDYQPVAALGLRLCTMANNLDAADREPWATVKRLRELAGLEVVRGGR